MHSKGCYSAFDRCDESPDRDLGPLRALRGLPLRLRPLRRVFDRDPGPPYVHSEGCYSAFGRCDEFNAAYAKDG